MTARELIFRLSRLPDNARVYHLWDGEARTEIEFVWESKDGSIVTSDFAQHCRDENKIPVGEFLNDDGWGTPDRDLTKYETKKT